MTVHTLKLQRDAEEMAQEARGQERAAGFLGSLLVGPVVVVPAMAGAGSVAVTAGESLTGANFLLPLGSLNMATAAEPGSQQPTSSSLNLKPRQDFVWWPD